MCTKKIFVMLSVLASSLSLLSCADDDSFSLSPSNVLTFSSDTISLDTVFSTVPSSTSSFWIYNNSGKGIRCPKIRLAAGNQSGFRVNVDGEYLSPTSGYQVSDIEIRDKDSVRVFVELTSPENGKRGPQLREDNLIFMLESGVEQRVNLKAYTWDATLLRNVVVENDSVIDAVDKPVVIYGGLTVDSLATLSVTPGSTLYFHSDADLKVYGRLIAEGTAENNIVMRGDRLDNMFDYLPYDQMSGQWRGVRFYSSSYENRLSYTDVHGAFDGVTCDSSDLSRLKLQLYNSTIHNCQGYGLKSVNSLVDIRNTQISNTLNDCLAIFGGGALLWHCTLAQFYPFDAKRGAALRFANYLDDVPLPLYQMDCINTIVTGYAADVIEGVSVDDGETAFDYRFVNSLLRTPKPDGDDEAMAERFVNVTFEDPEDKEAVTGEKHFRLVDIDRQRYDFHLDSISPAINNGSVEYALPVDRDGVTRDELPDIGCFEYVDTATE